jgi:hypothetical protein
LEKYRSLIGRGLGNRADEQRLDPDPRVEDLLLGESGVDNVDDSVDCKRRFGDIRGHDDFPARDALFVFGRRLIKDLLLHGRRQRRVERDNRDVAHVVALLLALLPYLLAAGLDFLLTGQKDQNVSGLLVRVDLHGGFNRVLEVVLDGFIGVVELDRVQTAGNFEPRGVIEIFLKFFSV